MLTAPLRCAAARRISLLLNNIDNVDGAPALPAIGARAHAIPRQSNAGCLPRSPVLILDRVSRRDPIAMVHTKCAIIQL